MAGLLNAKTYMIIALFTAGLCALIIYFDTNQQTAAFFTQLGSDASPFLGGNITNLIYTPLANIFSDYYWAIAAGVMWPLVVIWMGLMLVGLIASIVGPSIAEVNSI